MIKEKFTKIIKSENNDSAEHDETEQLFSQVDALINLGFEEAHKRAKKLGAEQYVNKFFDILEYQQEFIDDTWSDDLITFTKKSFKKKLADIIEGYSLASILAVDDTAESPQPNELGESHDTGDSIEQYESQTIEKYPFHEITSKERERVFQKLYSEGTYHGCEVTPRNLKRADLPPKYATELEGREFYFSRPFHVDQSRLGVIGFVEDEEHNYVARPFYRSRSQTLFRLLPDFYSRKDDNNDNDDYVPGMNHYGKGWSGFAEDSLNLPAELQNVLASITDDAIKPSYKDTLRLQLFMSTSHRRPYRPGDDSHNPANSYYSTVGEKAIDRIPYIDGKKYEDFEEYIPPEVLEIEGERAPNFEEKYMSYKTNTPIYGDVTMDCFFSRDHQKKYIFYRDSQNRAGIAAIESNAPLTSLGVRSQWVESGRFTLPAYEYQSNLELFGFDRGAPLVYWSDEDFPYHPQIGYTDTFKNYLSKAPIIQDYLHSQDLEPPEYED